MSDGRVVASTLVRADQESLAHQMSSSAEAQQSAPSILLGGSQFLYAKEDLSQAATSPMHLRRLEVI